jgi:uncharacterized membrane protein
MSRKRANKAEAIVRGIGAVVMLILLYVATLLLPRILKGQSTDEMIRTMIRFIVAFVALGGVITTVGLIVCFKARKR